MNTLKRLIAVIVCLLWIAWMFTLVIPIIYWIVTGKDYLDLKYTIYLDDK